MTIDAFYLAWKDGLGNPTGSRYTAQLFYDSVNNGLIWIVPRAPKHLLSGLQGVDSKTGTTNNFALPADFAGHHSLMYGTIPALFYKDTELEIFANGMYASSATRPCYTIRNGKYEILHTIIVSVITNFHYIKNATPIAAVSGTFSIPEILHEALLEYALYWVKLFDREWDDAKVNLANAEKHIKDIGGNTDI